MRRNIIIGFLILIVSIGLVACSNAGQVDDDILRIHIRANSNEVVDQNVKYRVKDAVVAYLTPIVAGCESIDVVIDKIECETNAITQVVNNVLTENGFDYGCRVGIREEYFPTRAYESCTLNANFYDALIISLGSGEGDNWWCVVYPPLCFRDTKNVVYRSKIMEIIDKYF